MIDTTTTDLAPALPRSAAATPRSTRPACPRSSRPHLVRSTVVASSRSSARAASARYSLDIMPSSRDAWCAASPKAMRIRSGSSRSWSTVPVGRVPDRSTDGLLSVRADQRGRGRRNVGQDDQAHHRVSLKTRPSGGPCTGAAMNAVPRELDFELNRVAELGDELLGAHRRACARSIRSCGARSTRSGS